MAKHNPLTILLNLSTITNKPAKICVKSQQRI